MFVGFGMIDILFKRVALAGVPLGASLQADVRAGPAARLRRAAVATRCTAAPLQRAQPRCGGPLLGLANFGNILFYLRGHQALPQHPALVFASMNLGVVALGALVGMLAVPRTAEPAQPRRRGAGAAGHRLIAWH